MKMFHELQSLPLIKEEKIDDDCERGRNKAYQVLVTLMEYKAIDIKNEGKEMFHELHCGVNYFSKINEKSRGTIM